ncbi:MAG: energy transducer TonB [Saprospiraceae bacterium]|nr:energy transducer TonB [Saprospiraceae bacterium]
MSNKKYNRSGIIGTIAFHLILVFALVLMGLKFEVPPPEGVEVNIGFSDDGMGDTKSVDPASEAAAPQASETEENVATQDTYEAPTVKKKNPKNKIKPKEDPEPVIDPNKLYQKKNNSGENEGETGKPGNQGNEGGDVNAKNHEGTPGTGGNGPKVDLSNRTVRSLPKPNYNSQEQGRVVVTIWVDKSGKVTNAVAGAQGTNVYDPELLKEAVNAALKAKFNVSYDAADVQKGTITYNFIRLN